jgi:hypothetical protein
MLRCFWYDLKLWQFLKMKQKNWQNLYNFQIYIYSKLIAKKNDILQQL